MPSPRETRAVLERLTDEAVGTSLDLFSRLRGAPAARRLALLDGLPDAIDYYAEGSAALAADFYEEERELAGVREAFAAELVIADRTVKTRRAIAWSTQPLFDDGSAEAIEAGLLTTSSRLAEVIHLDVARPFRDTITTNRQNDPAAVGWRRITNGGCGFCRMLADRGAVYRDVTARFAAHKRCRCTAQPVFKTSDPGVEASVMQYKASRRSKSPEQRAQLNAYIAEYFPG